MLKFLWQELQYSVFNQSAEYLLTDDVYKQRLTDAITKMTFYFVYLSSHIMFDR